MVFHLIHLEADTTIVLSIRRQCGPSRADPNSPDDASYPAGPAIAAIRPTVPPRALDDDQMGREVDSERQRGGRAQHEQVSLKEESLYQRPVIPWWALWHDKENTIHRALA